MPHLQPRVRPENQPEIDVDFIISEGERIDRVSLGPGLNYFGFAVGVGVTGDEPRETSDNTMRAGLVIYLPGVTITAIRDIRREERAEQIDPPAPDFRLRGSGSGTRRRA